MKTLWIVLVTVIVAGGLTAEGTYYYLNKKATDDKKVLQTQIDKLNKDITTLDSQLTATTGSTATTGTTATAGWKTYTNSTGGFSLKYPSNWTAAERQGNDVGVPVLRLHNPATTSLPNSDISIYYYGDIATADGNVPKTANTLLDLVSDQSKYINPVKTTFAGQATAYEATEVGMSNYYAIIVQKGSHIYDIVFDHRESKSQLSSEERTILDNFQFTN